METASSPSSSRSLDNPRGQNQEATRVLELDINGQEEAAVSGQPVNSNIVLHDTGLAGADAIPGVAADDTDAISGDVAVDADEVATVQNSPNDPVYTAPPAPRTGFRSVCGRRKEMEDAVSIVRNFLTLPAAPQDTHSLPSDLHFYAVYDGHGGAQAAIHCREHLHLALAEEMLRGPSVVSLDDMESWQSAMKATFLRMDGEVGSNANTDQQGIVSSTSSDTVGSTAIVAVLSSRHIIVANCGDSRAVLCRRGQAIPLSKDHKPDREDEMARIEAAGGRVICWNGWRVLGVLAMSRAIGDHFLKPYVIADPDVTMTERSEEDDCLILASDGLWDVVSNQDACTIAKRCLTANREAQVAAAALAHTAHEKGSSDNISVVVVDLRPHVRNGVFM